jgi:hypothetical protein
MILVALLCASSFVLSHRLRKLLVILNAMVRDQLPFQAQQLAK